MDNSFSSIATSDMEHSTNFNDKNDIQIIYPILDCSDEITNEIIDQHKKHETDEKDQIISDNIDNADNLNKMNDITNLNIANMSMDEKLINSANDYLYYELIGLGLLTLVSFGGFVCYRLFKK